MRLKTIFLLLLLVSTAAQAKTLVFWPRIADQVPAAMKNLKSGDHVVFQSGTYRLNHGILLEGLEDVVIEGKGGVNLIVTDLNDDVIALESCSRIQVKGLRARHETPADDYRCEGAVIRCRNSQKLFIAENHLNGCGASGVFAMSSKDIVIYKNHIFNNTYAGVWLQDASATVHRNKIYDNASALITYGKCGVSLTDNTIESNGGNIYYDTAYFRLMTGER